MTRDLVLDLIDHYGLSEFRDQLERHLRPSVRIRTERFPYDASGLGSKFGDLPLLPDGVAWPTWDTRPWYESHLRFVRERAERNPKIGQKWLADTIARADAAMRAGPAPLGFVGQIQLEEVPEAGLVGLPGGGRLLFFYDAELSPGGFDPASRGSGQVLYVPGGAGAVRRPPAGLPESAVSRAASLTFEPEWTLPEDPRVEGIALDPFADGDDRYLGLLRELYGGEQVMHRIGGNGQAIQGDMRLEAQLVMNGIYCGDSRGYEDPRRPALEAGAGDWVLLLQVDSDQDGPGWMWGDLGRLHYWIRRQDLRELNFGNVWCSQQCH